MYAPYFKCLVASIPELRIVLSVIPTSTEVGSIVFYCFSPIYNLIVPFYLKDISLAVSTYQACQQTFIDYIAFKIPNESFSDITNCIGIMRGFVHDLNSVKKGYSSLEAVLLSVPDGYYCADLSLYKVMTGTLHLFQYLIYYLMFPF